MKKLFYRTLFLTLITFFLFILYFSIIGFETNKFNAQINNKFKEIHNELEIELNDVKLILNPLNLSVNAKTLGTKIKHNSKTVDFEYIKSKISLKSLIKNDFSLLSLEASTKSLELKNLISFNQSFNRSTELFILEKFIKRGYLIADIKFNFDNKGNIKDNFKINGFVKDTKIDVLNKYKIENLNFIFNLDKKNLKLQDLKLLLNKNIFYSKELIISEIKDKFKFVGEIENDNLTLNQNVIDLFIKPYINDIDFRKIRFNSKNNFSFKLSKNLKFENFELKSKINIKDLSIKNNFRFQKILPDIKEIINFSDQKLEIELKKNEIKILGKGNILLQNNKNKINYSIKKRNEIYDFKISMDIKDNPLVIDFLDYKNNISANTKINIKGKKEIKKNITFNLISLKESTNIIEIKNLLLDEKFRVIDLDSARFDLIDEIDNINKFEILKKNKNYYLKGQVFNAGQIIENLLNDNTNSKKVLNNDFKVFVEIEKLLLDKKYKLNNLKGHLSIKDQEIINANLSGNFSKKKKLNYTVKTIDQQKITTLFLDEADAIVNRYKFVKGFKGGSLDFYSSKQNNESYSKLKIYDFKLRELPALTKLLTLASLQGIADLVSGEGIGFDEFEMNFKNKGNLMTIREIYAIGPAISILMDGYVEQNKLISLRGTLVPATTINKAIGSIPVLGKILVGSKTGEGVFGVSFKIKGPPKKLETTVNPIKTLTPRFITRTLEKIKKN